MKADLHPDYKTTTIKCVCGNEVETGSTKDGITVDICAKCHPFFTGKQKFVDTGGRIDKFNKRLDAPSASNSAPAPKAKKEKPEEVSEEKPASEESE